MPENKMLGEYTQFNTREITYGKHSPFDGHGLKQTAHYRSSSILSEPKMAGGVSSHLRREVFRANDKTA